MIRKKIHNLVFVFISSILLITIAGCSTIPGTTERVSAARNLFAIRNFETAYIGVGPGRVFTAYRITDPARPTRIYIEGDGFAYIASYQPSPDPTPLEPVLASLATADPGANVVYIGRPCQYGHDGCVMADWTTERFGRRNFEAIAAAVDTIKAKYGLHGLEFVGYSGGAHFAALLAATRCDTTGLRSIAGNLDIGDFTKYHHIDPLTVSDEALMHRDALHDVPQLHLVSRDDRVIPPALVQRYLDRLSSPVARAIVVEGPSHGKGWDGVRGTFINQSLPARMTPTCTADDSELQDQQVKHMF